MGVLAHHGVKGMKWGTRKAPEHGASADHMNVQSHNEKAKGSGVQALSNKELQDVITRRNLERQYNEAQANSRPFSRGHKLIKGVLNGLKTVNDTVNTVDSTIKTVKKAGTIAGEIGKALA